MYDRTAATILVELVGQINQALQQPVTINAHSTGREVMLRHKGQDKEACDSFCDSRLDMPTFVFLMALPGDPSHRRRMHNRHIGCGPARHKIKAGADWAMKPCTKKAESSAQTVTIPSHLLQVQRVCNPHRRRIRRCATLDGPLPGMNFRSTSGRCMKAIQNSPRTSSKGHKSLPAHPGQSGV